MRYDMLGDGVNYISPHYTTPHYTPHTVTNYTTQLHHTIQAKSVLGNKGDMQAVDGQLTELARQITGQVIIIIFLTLHLRPALPFSSTHFISLPFICVLRCAPLFQFFLFVSFFTLFLNLLFIPALNPFPSSFTLLFSPHYC